MVSYKYLTETTVAKIDDDGTSRMSCSIENPEFMAWLAEGNTPESSDPVPAPPIIVSPRQIRQALTRANLREQVESAVAAGDQDMRDWWEFATAVEENHPMVVGMAQSLGVNDSSLHDLFALASTL